VGSSWVTRHYRPPLVGGAWIAAGVCIHRPCTEAWLLAGCLALKHQWGGQHIVACIKAPSLLKEPRCAAKGPEGFVPFTLSFSRGELIRGAMHRYKPVTHGLQRSKTLAILLPMNSADLINITIALTSIAVAVYALFQTRVAKLQTKLAFVESFRHWVNDTIDILMLREALMQIHKKDVFLEKRNQCLIQLSAQIEKGRLYVPNIPGSFGSEKESAYRGHRPLLLDFLVYTYDTLATADTATELESSKVYLLKNHRGFVSEAQQIINPDGIISELQKHASYIIAKERVKVSDQEAHDEIQKYHEAQRSKKSQTQ